MTVQEQYDKINANILTMDLPINRKDAARGQNLQWLLRNLRVRNASHPKCAETLALLTELGRADNKLRACDVYPTSQSGLDVAVKAPLTLEVDFNYGAYHGDNERAKRAHGNT